MPKLLVKNTKIANSNDSKHVVYNFGLPAFRSESGFKTCPMAGLCAKGCYAQSGAYLWPVVKAAYEYRLEMSLKADFAAAIALELMPKAKLAAKQGKQLVIRIHDSGDFYNIAYLKRWLKVINQFPEVIFYAYTKMIPMFKKLNLPNNFIVIYSEGGLADELINPKIDRHSRVFDSMEALLAAGYANTTENDLNAIGTNNKIGLVYHGHKSKAWETNKRSA